MTDADPLGAAVEAGARVWHGYHGNVVPWEKASEYTRQARMDEARHIITAAMKPLLDAVVGAMPRGVGGNIDLAPSPSTGLFTPEEITAALHAAAARLTTREGEG